MKTIGSLTAIFFFLLVGVVHAGGLIDFETVPGEAPVDQLTISSQYEMNYGVSFALDTNGDGLIDVGQHPNLEKVGSIDSGHGFANLGRSSDDIAAIGFETQLGDYFLRLGTGNYAETPVPSLIISYTSSVQKASAEIWDIDGYQGTEQWEIEALGASNEVIDSILSPIGTDTLGPLDGKPWTWFFNHTTDDIYAVRINFIGTRSSEIGLGFDNFSYYSSVIPEPISSILFVTGGTILGLRGYIRKKKRE